MPENSPDSESVSFLFSQGYPPLKFRLEGHSKTLDQQELIEAISEDFGFDAEEDRASAALLEQLLLENKSIVPYSRTLGRLHSLIQDRTVLVAGSGASLDKQLKELLGPDNTFPPRTQVTIMAADGAVEGVISAGAVPDIIVSDLDGPLELITEALGQGAILIALAHGDNKEVLARFVPKLSGQVLGSTQREASPPLFNFGGFTDGDRGVLVAKAFEARKIVLMGFDFDEPGPYSRHADEGRKRKKLEWCQQIVGNVEGVVDFREWK